jgi:hypothetical protein
MGIIALRWGNDPEISKNRNHCGVGSAHWECFCRGDCVNLIRKSFCGAVLTGLTGLTVLTPAFSAAAPINKLRSADRCGVRCNYFGDGLDQYQEKTEE